MKSGKIVSEGNILDVLTEEGIKTVFNVESRVYFDQYSGSCQVYIIDPKIVSRPTLRLLDGIYEIGKILYPKKFN
ncbi:MAG: hypothetical protein U9Q89_02715 [Thermodesulfobacteriota bacterium]|nr:hypothetical protein [Thermodesulfobacteriota bacterium]